MYQSQWVLLCQLFHPIHLHWVLRPLYQLSPLWHLSSILQSIRPTPSNDAVSIEFKQITLKAGENKYTKVASISLDGKSCQLHLLCLFWFGVMWNIHLKSSEGTRCKVSKAMKWILIVITIMVPNIHRKYIYLWTSKYFGIFNAASSVDFYSVLFAEWSIHTSY